MSKFPYKPFDSSTKFGVNFAKWINNFADLVGLDLKEQKARTDNLIRNTPQPSELVDLRVDEEGVEHPTARDRIISDSAKVSANFGVVNEQLATKVYYFNTVADMIASSKLKEGDYVFTLGFYSPNDGGEGKYRIGTISSNGYFDLLLDNGLTASFIIRNNEVNIRQLGARSIQDTGHLNKMDCKSHIEAFLNRLNILPELRYTLYIPSGVWCFSPTLISRVFENFTEFSSQDYGVSIRTDGGFSRSNSFQNSFEGTVINAFQNNQEYVWKITGTNNSFEGSYLFTANGCETKWNNRISAQNSSFYTTTYAVVVMDYVNSSEIGNFHFAYYSGNGLWLVDCWEINFNYLNFNYIRGKNEATCLTTQNRSTGCSTIHINNMRFENVSCVLGDFSISNTTIGNIFFEEAWYGTGTSYSLNGNNGDNFTNVSGFIIRYGSALNIMSISMNNWCSKYYSDPNGYNYIRKRLFDIRTNSAQARVGVTVYSINNHGSSDANWDYVYFDSANGKVSTDSYFKILSLSNNTYGKGRGKINVINFPKLELPENGVAIEDILLHTPSSIMPLWKNYRLDVGNSKVVDGTSGINSDDNAKNLWKLAVALPNYDSTTDNTFASFVFDDKKSYAIRMKSIPSTTSIVQIFVNGVYVAQRNLALTPTFQLFQLIGTGVTYQSGSFVANDGDLIQLKIMNGGNWKVYGDYLKVS